MPIVVYALLNAPQIQQMADKNHPNIVRLLGFAVGGDIRTRPEQVLIYEFVPNGDLATFGVLILVVLTGRTHNAETSKGSMHVLPWVDECLSKGDLAGLKSSGMDAPKEVLLRLTQLAVSCTVDRTANRQTMGDVANELQAVRNEVGGKEEVRGAVKVDVENEERMSAHRIHQSLDEAIDSISDVV
ncbi:unnamed protein product [Closterium sp. Naga37s-1]|nr:unnamed protein product [Closterium sp. Naga37s-1]